jgi:hypothetical protein
MNGLDDLRRTLETQAAYLPDEAGLVAGARTRAATIRRRRRLTVVAAAAVVVLLAASAVPVALHRRAATPSTPYRPAGNRQPWQMTLTMDPSYPVGVTWRSSFATSQTLTIEEDRVGIDVRADRGARLTYPGDPAPEPVTVQGRPAWFHRERVVNASTRHPARVEWIDPDGNRLEVTATVRGTTRADLLSAAEAVRLGAPRAVPMPLRLGPLPAGLALTSVVNLGYRPETLAPNVSDIQTATMELGSAGTIGARVNVNAREKLHGTPRPDVAGHPATFSTGRFAGELSVQAGPCVYEFYALNPAITEARLRELAAGSTYADCTRPSSWIAPIG